MFNSLVFSFLLLPHDCCMCIEFLGPGSWSMSKLSATPRRGRANPQPRRPLPPLGFPGPRPPFQIPSSIVPVHFLQVRSLFSLTPADPIAPPPPHTPALHVPPFNRRLPIPLPPRPPPTAFYVACDGVGGVQRKVRTAARATSPKSPSTHRIRRDGRPL